MVGFWADDAVVLAPDQPAVVGKAAIREFVKHLGYLVEHNRVTFADSTGARQTHFGKAVTVWRKEASGAWKCIVDTWNDSPSELVFPR